MTNDVLAKFLAFSAALADNLSARSEVIGLVLVGSTADTKRVDEWSDHDFFVFTQEGGPKSFARIYLGYPTTTKSPCARARPRTV